MATRKKILILAANPKDTTWLRLDEEVREIKEGLRLAKKRELFEIEQREAVRIRDLRRALLDCEPQIVHFSGHGEADGIMVEDETGNSVLVEPDALAGLFDLFSDQVECVLLNACFSESQASAINQHIKYVIGMKKEIGDKAAIEFAVGFYDALGAGRTIEQAFKFGSNAIELESIPEHLTPVLKINSGLTDVVQSKKDVKQISEQGRIFISYKHDVNPDETVAMQVAKALEQRGHYVFIDKNMIIGTKWIKRIDDELKNADFFIPFLSENSIFSEMVKGEVEKAYQLAKEQNGKPQTLPVRLNYREPFNYPINKYLNHIYWAIWDEPNDTARIIDELVHAIDGNSLPISPEQQKEFLREGEKPEFHVPTYSAQPINLEMPEGTIDPESKFYIERPTDKIALEAIQRQGVTITIKAPRQMGKSSLLMRIIKAAQKLDKSVVFLDFQLFDKSSFKNADTFYQQFCTWLTDELELDDKLNEYWENGLSHNLCCTRYVQRHLLDQVKKPLVLAMDEVEAVFDTPFRSDFFSMLRSWHNKRSTSSIWKNLDLALITSTEPYQLIENLNQSPFNVGEVIELSDFNLEQIFDLNQRHGLPFNSKQVEQLMDLLNGHPYLVRRALYLVASGRITGEDLLAKTLDDRGPFGDHLRYHLFRLYGQEDLIQGLNQVIDDNICPDERIFFRLRGAGLIRSEGKKVLPRCKLYADYLMEHLND